MAPKGLTGGEIFIAFVTMEFVSPLSTKSHLLLDNLRLNHSFFDRFRFAGSLSFGAGLLQKDELLTDSLACPVLFQRRFLWGRAWLIRTLVGRRWHAWASGQCCCPRLLRRHLLWWFILDNRCLVLLSFAATTENLCFLVRRLEISQQALRVARLYRCATLELRCPGCLVLLDNWLWTLRKSLHFFFALSS